MQRRLGMHGLHPDRRGARDVQRRLRHRVAQVAGPGGVGQRVAREQRAALHLALRVDHAVRVQLARARGVDRLELRRRQLLQAHEIGAAAPRERHDRVRVGVPVAEVRGQDGQRAPPCDRLVGPAERARRDDGDQRERGHERDDRDRPLPQQERDEHRDPRRRGDVRREGDRGHDQRAAVQSEDPDDRPDEPGQHDGDGDRGPHRASLAQSSCAGGDRHAPLTAALRSWPHDHRRLGADRPLPRRPDRADAAPRRLHGARLRPRARRPGPRPRTGRARLPPPPRHARRAEQDWRGYARSVLVFSAASWSCSTSSCARSRIHRCNPHGLGACPGTSRSTPPRRS